MHVGRGFSLIELLAALALASVLMLAVMQVTASLGRVSAAMDGRGDSASPWRRDLEALLQTDLEQAMFAVAESDELHLEGLIGLGLERAEPTLVKYRLIKHQDEESGLLVREQRSLLERSNRPGQRELVAARVTAFEPEVLEPGERERSPNAAPAEGQSVRPRLGRLVISFTDQPQLVIEQELP